MGAQEVGLFNRAPTSGKLSTDTCGSPQRDAMVTGVSTNTFSEVPKQSWEWVCFLIQWRNNRGQWADKFIHFVLLNINFQHFGDYKKSLLTLTDALTRPFIPLKPQKSIETNMSACWPQTLCSLKDNAYVFGDLSSLEVGITCRYF